VAGEFTPGHSWTAGNENNYRGAEEEEIMRINKKALLVLSGLLFLLLSSFCHVYAGDAYFDISFDRSVNIAPPEGRSRISDIGDSVTLNKKGRLWLTGNETAEGFVEIVCQNLSTESVSVQLTNTEKPWVNITEPAECNDWQKNILICPIGKMKKGFFCKITERTVMHADEGSKKQKSASVNVRAISVEDLPEKSFDEQQYLQERLEYYAAGIDLCNTIHKRSGNIIIQWIIYDGGAVDKVVINSQTAPGNEEIANCIAEQIPFWKFPEWRKDSQVAYQF
jgi:hypothetical protein